MIGVDGVQVLQDLIFIVLIPWLVNIDRRLSRIEGYLKRLNNAR